ncbi:MAG: electron transport complex subunit E [Myxococcales bacterium]|nr:electron transport complex subunit E [Myxococcales bacterium]MCB9580376.1 electron transport complex subunit E [Polyangiaceae bacterium]
MASEEKQAWPELTKGLWRENPVFIAVLGLCPSMAVTNSLKNGLVMGIATTFVLFGSSSLVSALRKVIPKQVRISAYIIIIATFVTCVDFVLAAAMPEAHKQLGAFIALIVVNCVILGRAEAFAAKNSVGLAMADALGMSGGFTLALAMIGGIREILGSGSLLGFPIMGEHFEPWAIMVLPPGGFLTLGVLLTTFAWVKKRRAQRAAPAAERIEGEVA